MRNPMLLILFTLVFATACGRGSRSKSNQPPKPTYESCLAQGLLFYAGGCYAGSGLRDATGRYSLLPNPILLHKFTKPVLNVCLLNEGFPAARIIALQYQVKSAFEEWSNLTADLSSNPVPTLNFVHNIALDGYLSDEDITAKCPQDTDMTISLQKTLGLGTSFENREHAYTGNASIFLKGDSDYPTILHEMGHLFGLDDIYVEGVWNCREGFANSMMCDHAWNKPILDDIESVRRSFCLATDGEHASCFNHQKASVLHFLPEHSIRNRTLSPGAYFYCSSEEGSFAAGYNIVGYTKANLENEGESENSSGRFFSTDEKSIKEIFTPESYSLTIDTAYVDLNHGTATLSTNATSTRYLIQDDIVRITVPDHAVDFDIPQDNCIFDGKFLDFLTRQGVKFDPVHNARLPYSRFELLLQGYMSRSITKGVEQRIRLESDDFTPKSKVTLFSASREKTQLKSFVLSDLGMKKEDDGTYSIALEKLELEEGSYHFYFESERMEGDTNGQVRKMDLEVTPSEEGAERGSEGV